MSCWIASKWLAAHFWARAGFLRRTREQQTSDCRQKLPARYFFSPQIQMSRRAQNSPPLDNSDLAAAARTCTQWNSVATPYLHARIDAIEKAAIAEANCSIAKIEREITEEIEESSEDGLHWIILQEMQTVGVAAYRHKILLLETRLTRLASARKQRRWSF